MDIVRQPLIRLQTSLGVPRVTRTLRLTASDRDVPSSCLSVATLAGLGGSAGARPSPPRAPLSTSPDRLPGPVPSMQWNKLKNII